MTNQIEDATPAAEPTATPEAMLRGARRRCPACGNGRLYAGFLEVADHCPSCDEALHHHRADDAPPYFTILIVGHVIVAGVLSVEKAFAPPTWVQLALWLPLTLLLSIALLPSIKGALVGLQWALGMHGFDRTRADPATPLPDPADGHADPRAPTPGNPPEPDRPRPEHDQPHRAHRRQQTTTDAAA